MCFPFSLDLCTCLIQAEKLCVCVWANRNLFVSLQVSVVCVCVLNCNAQHVCVLSGNTSSGHWLSLFDVKVLAAVLCVSVCVCFWLGRTHFIGPLEFYIIKYFPLWIQSIPINLLLYSRWKPAATTLMSLWKCKSSWLDVELRRAGAVVPVQHKTHRDTIRAMYNLGLPVVLSVYTLIWIKGNQ